MIHILKKGLLLLLGLILFIGITLSAFVYFVPNNLGGEKRIYIINIKPSETGLDIANILNEKGLIRSPLLFRIALKVTGTADKLQAGYYQIPNNINLHNLISILQKGHLKTYTVTIPEGFTILEIADRLDKEGIVNKNDLLNEAKHFIPYDYMYGPYPVEYKVEGFLFPDTYKIPIGSTSKDILKLMTSEMNKKLTPEIRNELRDKNITIFDFITLASIVEREALFDNERPIIAAVFLKRLKDNIPLQSCATVEYILGQRKPILSEADTKIQNPYNTYIVHGLPPGPISNPGIKSMEAVLHAPKTDYLYFVADKEGHHHFSKTYEEHLQEIKKIYGDQ